MYIITQKSVPCIKMFSSLSEVREVSLFWVSPYLNIF